MRPLDGKTPDKSQAFGKAILLFFPRTGVIHNTSLEVYSGYNSDAMSQEWVSDFEALYFEHLDEIDDP
jgi:hypothetical protein